MARKGRKDRGLYVKRNASGQLLWRVRLWHDGKRRQFGSFNTKTQARSFYEQAKADQRLGRFFPEAYQRRTAPTLQRVLDNYLGIARAKLTYRADRSFAKWWGARLGTRTILSITAADLDQGRADLLQTVSPARVNRYTDWLRHVLNLEVKAGRLARNPVLALDRFQENEAPIHVYSEEQEGQLAEALGPVQAEWVRIAILTGLRRGNQFRLRKEWIHWNEDLVVIPSSKTRRPRLVFLSAEAKELLHRQCDRHPTSSWVFPSRTKRNAPMSPDNWYGKVFRPACVQAGLPSDLKWHTLRHTFGSRLAKLGATLQDIMAAGGWTSYKAALRYIHRHRKDLVAMAGKLSDIKPTPSRTGTSLALDEERSGNSQPNQ